MKSHPEAGKGRLGGEALSEDPAATPDYPAARQVAFWGPPLDRITGGNLYDRELVAHLRGQGRPVTVHAVAPGEAPGAAEAAGAAVVIQDELLHREFAAANRALASRSPRPAIVALVHHLASDEPERSADERRRLRASETAYLRTVDALVCPSRATVEAAMRLIGARPPCAIAPPGRDRLGGSPLPDDRPRPGEIRARAHRRLQVAFVGNLIPRKRLLELLEALAKVRDWRLAVAGREDADPAHAARVRARARRPDLAGRISFQGPLAANRLAALLRDSQLLAVPSTHEGFGMVYLEGFAFGLPALAAGRGGAVELVEEGRTGFLVPPDDPTAVGLLSARLDGLAADRDRLGAMGVAAALRHRAHPTWSESLGAVVRLLDGLSVVG